MIQSKVCVKILLIRSKFQCVFDPDTRFLYTHVYVHNIPNTPLVIKPKLTKKGNHTRLSGSQLHKILIIYKNTRSYLRV